jgi:hypothetical protein
MLISVMKAYQEAATKILGPAVHVVATNTLQRLVGFWVMWHLMGERDGLRAIGYQDKAIQRSRKEFQHAFGMSVDEFWPEAVELIRAEALKEAERVAKKAK